MGDAQKRLNTQQVAHYCGVSSGTVESWLEKGRLTALLEDEEYLINANDLIHFMQQNHLAIPADLMTLDAQHAPITTNVLVIDEDRAMALSIERVLRSMSLEVIRLSGMEACLYSGQYRPELVTLDLSLEGVNGIELIEQIRFGCRPQPKILVITDSMPSLISKARIAGADAILNKPFDNDALRRNVRILLGLD